MTKTIKYIEFSKLRHAYIVIKKFIEKESGEKINSLNQKFEEDNISLGDDNRDLINHFVEKFELNYGNFKHEKHFHTEVELSDPYVVLSNMFILPIWLPLKTIELMTFNNVKFDKPKFQKPDREVLDMTFKGLIIWYLEKEYKLEDDIEYQIKTTHNRGEQS